MTRRWNVIVGLTIALSFGASARWSHAQTPASASLSPSAPRAAVIEGKVQVVTEQATGGAATGTPAADGTKPAAAAAPSPRLQKLQTLNYDRRPSSILKAWALPEPTIDDTKATEKKAGSDNAENGEAAPDFQAPIEGLGASFPQSSKVVIVSGRLTRVATASTAAVSATTGAAPAASAPAGASPAAPAAAGAPVPPASGPAPAADSATPAPAADPSATPATPAPPAIDPKVLDLEMRTLQRNVTLGRWDRVKAYFQEIPVEEGKEGHAQLLRSLQAGPQENRQRNNNNMPIEQNLLELGDIIGIAAASPIPLERPVVTQLATFVQLALQAGVLPDTIVARLESEAAKSGDDAILNRRQCAWMLAASGQTAELEKFLPTFEEVRDAKDAEGLILLSQCQAAKHAKEGKPEMLERAFTIAQPVLAMTEAKQEQRDEALQLVLGLVPRVREDLGIAWLDQTFAGDPQFGMKVLAGMGSTAATALMNSPQDSATRLQNLKIQKTVVESLFEKQPQRVAEWEETIRLLAFSWLKEAELSRTMDRSTSYGPRMQRDPYGNYFYINDDGMMEMQNRGRQQQVQPIASAEVIDTAPGSAWLAKLDDEFRPKFLAIQAQLLLKVSEDERAFPLIEGLAASYPNLARDLTHEFIRVWTRNHDPNSNSRYTNSYMYMYGFEQRANGIPLTRSKQERNLAELAAWIPRIRALPIKNLDESLFATAFTTCHSSAEVYRIDAIEKVFGPIASMDAKMLAQLAQQMRTNLTALWRMPAQQEQAKTQRKQKDIEAEVVRGYGVARTVLEGGVQKYPDDWRLALAQACLLLDEISYRNEIAPSSQFSELRLGAIDRFRHAADLYAQALPTLPDNEQAATVFEHWFYAGLGASDLAQIDHRSTADSRQPALIRDAILALPGEAAEKHRGFFANSLFTRMSALKPNVKYNYLKAGFEIAGDAKQAREARKVYDYYNDLVSEIQLLTRVDGSPRVGRDTPFGVFIELRHTPEIERESGGFAKYLQNQNSMSYAYNYGRPLENYRDKFDEAVRAALEEHFDVQSVTFQEKDVHARASGEAGWRVTPYAYVLVKPRGPQVDKFPSLKMDLDFLDTSGYAVLPIVSAPLPVDAAAEKPDARPYSNLKVTQTLDERQAADGKLVLEIKATARGIVPVLSELLDVKASDFEVAATDDQGVVISKFDSESSEPAVVSERTWMVTYNGRTDLAALPTTFQFPEPKVAVADNTYQRYDDADLKSVDATVKLERKYGETRVMWPWYTGAGVLVALAAGILFRSLRRREDQVAKDQMTLPEKLTPFNVLAILKQIEHNNGYDAATKEELATSIRTLEKHYFSSTNGDAAPDLRNVAERWLARSRRPI